MRRYEPNHGKPARYLFSGLLFCGSCGGHIVIVSGWGKRGYAKYGCPSHRYRGVCRNRLTIRQDRLEAQLLGALEERILTPQMLDYTLRRFEEELKKRLNRVENQSTDLSVVEEERQKLQAQIDRLADAIADAGKSPSLLCRLAAAESKLADLTQQIEIRKAPLRAPATKEIRSFALEKMMDLRGLLRGDVERAKTALAKHITQLVLTPEETPGGPRYAVAGTVDVSITDGRVMRVVARDGIAQHYRAWRFPTAGIVLDPRLSIAA